VIAKVVRGYRPAGLLAYLFDLDLRPLTRTMQELADAAGLPLSNPPRITPHWAGHLERGGRISRNG